MFKYTTYNPIHPPPLSILMDDEDNNRDQVVVQPVMGPIIEEVLAARAA